MKLIADYRFEFLWMLAKELSICLESLPGEDTVTLHGPKGDPAPHVDDIWLYWRAVDELRHVRVMPFLEGRTPEERVLCVSVCYYTSRGHGKTLHLAHKASHRTACQDFSAFERFGKALTEQIFTYVLIDKVLPIED